MLHVGDEYLTYICTYITYLGSLLKKMDEDSRKMEK